MSDAEERSTAGSSCGARLGDPALALYGLLLRQAIERDSRQFNTHKHGALPVFATGLVRPPGNNTFCYQLIKLSEYPSARGLMEPPFPLFPATLANLPHMVATMSLHGLLAQLSKVLAPFASAEGATTRHTGEEIKEIELGVLLGF